MEAEHNTLQFVPCEPNETTEIVESLIQAMWELQAAAEAVGRKELMWVMLDCISTLAGIMMRGTPRRQRIGDN